MKLTVQDVNDDIGDYLCKAVNIKDIKYNLLYDLLIIQVSNKD